MTGCIGSTSSEFSYTDDWGRIEYGARPEEAKEGPLECPNKTECRLEDVALEVTANVHCVILESRGLEMPRDTEILPLESIGNSARVALPGYLMKDEVEVVKCGEHVGFSTQHVENKQ